MSDEPKMGSGLVLARKIGEALKIYVGDRVIVVRVHSLRGARVRLAVLADKDVRVLRAELGGDHHG